MEVNAFLANDFIDFRGVIIDYGRNKISFVGLDGFIMKFFVNKRFNLYFKKVIAERDVIIKSN